MFEEDVVKILAGSGVKTSVDKLEIPPQEEFGDLSFPCFELAKVQKRNPVEIANEIASKIKIRKNSVIEKVEVKGAYINFFFNWAKVVKPIFQNIFKPKKIDIGKKRKVMIEFSQPNTAHGLHIGHARATMLGESLANIMKYVGYNVVKTNYYGDFGTQMAKSIVAYLKWGKSKGIDKKPDLWDLYIKFHEEARRNPTLEEEAKEILRKLENGDKKIIQVWKKIRKLVLSGIKETYKRLGVIFDVDFYESQVSKLGKDIVKIALKKGVAQKSEGAIVTNLEKYGLPDTVLLKSDGTTVYQARDIGLAVKNFKDYKLDSRIYVVDVRQSLHFKQVFKILELLGYKWAKNLHHLGFGFVSLPEGLMASRSGRVVKLDEFLDELNDLAYKEVDKRNPKMKEKVKNDLAEKIGTSALIFALLRIEPEQNIVFNKEEIVKFEGDTGPYIQYSYTRCASILKKTHKWKQNTSNENLMNEEKKMIKMLDMFTKIVQNAAKNLRPHYLCNYTYELATIFSTFYEKCPVLKAENADLKNFRLTLVKATQIILGKCLELMGMYTVEKM